MGRYTVTWTEDCAAIVEAGSAKEAEEIVARGDADPQDVRQTLRKGSVAAVPSTSGGRTPRTPDPSAL